MIEPRLLLPRERSHFRYMSSLATPPCFGGLTWAVFHSAIEASPGGIYHLAQWKPTCGGQAAGKLHLALSGCSTSAGAVVLTSL